ncbi:MAG: hypothetical protein OXT65_10865 [Alphaproteobacteria bacterium]|nr:hypothetical protein [Alphaproteobacteria bacterium]
MTDTKELAEKFLKPWLEKNHPEADLVFVAGSYGRAMRNGAYQPIASSDVDMVIIYSDLEKAELKAASKIYTYEDMGTAMGGAPKPMMVDVNVHDFASLHYHDKTVKENGHFAFLNVMLDEGFILIDRTGAGPALQEKAGKFMEEGPGPINHAKWKAETETLETYRKDIAGANSVEEKRFLGTMALIHVCEYALGVNDYWRSGSNQAYRRLTKYFPDDADKIVDAFEGLTKNGNDAKVLDVLDDLTARGRRKLATLPKTGGELMYDIEQNVPKAELAQNRKLFIKFMCEHLTEALETSEKRGMFAHLENLSATIEFSKAAIALERGETAPQGRAGMHYLNTHLPDLMPVTLQALDEKEFDPLRAQVEKALSAVGGVHYSRLHIYYDEDLARVYATSPALANDNTPKNLPNFKP